MLYLFWGFINLVLLAVFFYACFKATKLLRQSIGTFTAIVFAFGLLSFVVKPSDKKKHFDPAIWRAFDKDSLSHLSSGNLHIQLQDNFLSEYQLNVTYKTNPRDSVIAVNGFAYTTGFVLGTSWQPVNINLSTTGKLNQLSYYVSSVVEWKLLGATCYLQPKTFRGTINP